MSPTTRLSNLPTRPPTPPKELSSDPALPTANGKPSAVLTPDSLSSRSPARGLKRKRVNFILTPTSSNASSPFSLPEAPSSTGLASSSPKRPSRGGKPGRSILKTTKHGPLSDITLTSDHLGITLNFSNPLTWKSDKLKMLDEVFVQLASSDKSTRLDAYQSLSAAMKKYNDMPKFDEFIRRVPALLDFIRRDLDLRKGDDHRDGHLSHEALKLATLLAWRDPTTLSDNAKELLLDQCIDILVDTTASKLLTNNCLFLLSCQSFDKTLNQSRVITILKTLQKIDSRISGAQVKILRLETYRKFILQCPKAMISHAASWIVTVMDGMLSDRPDVATKALSCGREAAIKLGAELEVSKAMEQLLKTPLRVRAPETTTDKERIDSPTRKIYSEVLAAKLQRIARDKSRSELVPQIWSVIILFLQRRRSVLTKAPTKQHLLSILQFCLNKVPITTKSRAIVAWRDLIYTLWTEMHQDRATLELLNLVFTGAFQRKDGEQALNNVEATYCTYLYFAIWPKASSETITWVWNNSIVSLLQMHNPKLRVRPEFALRVIGALLGTHQQVSWDADKALNGPPIQPADLPRIEPKWVVANIDLILDVLANHVKAVGTESDASIYTVWDAFNKCVVETRSHEIRPSSVTMNALASILTFVLKYASGAVSSEIDIQRPSNPLACLSRLLFSTVSAFGLIPCNEKVFSVDEHNIVHANESTKSADALDESHSVLAIAQLTLLSSCRTPCEPPSAVGDLLGLIITRKLAATTNCSRRLQSLAEMSEGSPRLEDHVPGEQAHLYCLRSVYWEQICKHLLDTLKNYSSSGSSPDSQSRGADFRYAVTILINGLDHAASVKTSWFQAWDLLLTDAKETLNESVHLSIAEGIVEPLAKGLLERMKSPKGHVRSEAGLDLVYRVLRSVKWPETTDTQQQAQRNLWGSMSANTKSDLHDPYSSVYDLFLTALQQDLIVNSSNRVDRAVTVFVDNCSAPFFWNMLQKIASGLERWLCNKMSDNPEPGYWFKLSGKIKDLWQIKPHNAMSAVRPILLAGLKSTVEEVVTEYVALWDSTISSAVSLENVSEFAEALAKANATLSSCKGASNQSKNQPSPKAVLPAQAPSTSLSNSPSRREWLLNKSPRQSRAPTPATPVLPTAAAEQPELSEVFMIGAEKDAILAPASPTHVASTPQRAVATEIELPSSPPELPAEPELPLIPASDDIDQANMDSADSALPMSDEFRESDQSPTPFVRRPFSAARSDMGVFDLPDSSPLREQTKMHIQSDPVGNQANVTASKKQRRSRASKSGLRSSKHFPINVEEEDAIVPRYAQSTKNATPSQQQPADVPTTSTQPMLTGLGANGKHIDIIDVDALPEKTGSKRRRSSSAMAHEQPPQKRGRGRPRKNLVSASVPQQIPHDMEGSPARESPSRPRKTAIPLPRKYPVMPTTQKSQSDDDLEDTIEVMQSQPEPPKRQPTKRTRLRSEGDPVVVDVPSSVADITPSGDGITRARRRKSRPSSSNSIEFIGDSFKNDGKTDNVKEKDTDDATKRRGSRAQKKRSSNANQQNALSEPEVASKDSNVPDIVDDIFSGLDDNGEAQETEQEVVQKRGAVSNGKKRKSISSPSSQLQGDMNPTTPKKKRRVSAFDEVEEKESSPPATPQSPLSKAAQNILAKLRGLLGDAKDAVLGRSEARETTRVLNQIAAIVPQISNAVMEAEDRGEGDGEI